MSHMRPEHHRGGLSNADINALRSIQVESDPQATNVVVSRTPANQYLSLNSKDRFNTASTGVYNYQPWNRFKLQRPQNLMTSFATRMVVSEINMPWYVPNINNLTNTIWINSELATAENPRTTFTVTLPNGFYTPAELVTALNTALNGTLPITGTNATGTLLNSPTVSYANSTFIWTPSVGAGGAFTLCWFNPVTNPSAPSSSVYQSSTSLGKLMGIYYSQYSSDYATLALTGAISSGVYTQYVDFVSDKLHQYTLVRDGSSDNYFNRNLILRLYISDETSMTVQGTAPFNIHRQFKNPKAVMFNKDAIIDWLDVALYDEWGNLLPLPSAPLEPNGVTPVAPAGSYPDFQITLLPSEN